MPKIIWKAGGQEKQERKKRSRECLENGNKAQSGRKGLQEEGGSCVDKEIKCETIAKGIRAHVRTQRENVERTLFRPNPSRRL